MDAMKQLVAQQAEMEAERHAHMIEAEREKRESCREKLAVELEKIAADKEKADSGKQMLSQMVQIMHTQAVMLTQVLGRSGAAGTVTCT